eukprot:511380-Rhodomonas_salina.3
MRWHIASGHISIRALMLIAETTLGMEELQQLPCSFKMKPCATCLLTVMSGTTYWIRSRRGVVRRSDLDYGEDLPACHQGRQE